MPGSRRDEVAGLLAGIPGWAAGRTDVRAVALVGSWARGGADEASDLDLIVLADDPSAYVSGETWLSAFGWPDTVRVQSWGPGLTERRVRTASGLEIEFGLAPVAWANVAPLDPGTARVVRDGMVALYDPSWLLGLLEGAVLRSDRSDRASDG